MILTDYYKCAEIKKVTSHRYDCTASTNSYEPFEVIAKRAKVKRFFFYLGDVPEQFNAHAKRKADRALTNGKNLSSLYVPDLNTPLWGYGDARGTKDALLFKFNESEEEVEIFVARGQKHNSRQLFNLFADGELDSEIEELRHRAQPTNVDTTLFP